MNPTRAYRKKGEPHINYSLLTLEDVRFASLSYRIPEMLTEESISEFWVVSELQKY